LRHSVRMIADRALPTAMMMNNDDDDDDDDDDDSNKNNSNSKMTERKMFINNYPRDSHNDGCLVNGPPANGADRMNNCQVTIERHQNQRVDTFIRRHNPHVLIDLPQNNSISK